jgi:hypothetical protein
VIAAFPAFSRALADDAVHHSGPGASLTAMLKAHVRNGRLVLDEPTELPEGAAVELVAVGTDAELDADDRRRLLEALSESEADVQQGRLVAADDVLASLRR